MPFEALKPTELIQKVRLPLTNINILELTCILLPFQGECLLLSVPKALPWADILLAFQAVNRVAENSLLPREWGWARELGTAYAPMGH